MSEGFGAVRDVSDDDAYDRLFRPEPDDAIHSTYASPSLVVEEAEPEVPVGRNLVDTGRLFRSVHAQAEPTALTAVPATEVPHLRTLRLENSEPVAPILSTRTFEPLPRSDYFDEAFADPAEVSESTPPEPEVEFIKAASYEVDDLVEPEPVVVDMVRFNDVQRSYEPAAEGFWAADAMHDFDWHTGLRTTSAYAIIIGATVVAGLASALLMGTGTGLVTGLVLLVASALVAARVRLPDAAVAVIAPPIAYFAACLTVGQIGLASTGGLVGRAIDIFFMLANGWYWVIGPAAVALAIVIWRRRRSDAIA